MPVIGSSGATATAKLLWDSGHRYVLATVTDPTLGESSSNLFEQDSVELFVDGQYRVSFCGGSFCGGSFCGGSFCGGSFTNHQSINGNFSAFAIADNLVSAARVVPGGYVVEASIQLDTITPAKGGLLGFDLQVNDAVGGTRTAATTWHDPTGLSYLNTSRWGVAQLA